MEPLRGSTAGAGKRFLGIGKFFSFEASDLCVCRHILAVANMKHGPADGPLTTPSEADLKSWLTILAHAHENISARASLNKLAAFMDCLTEVEARYFPFLLLHPRGRVTNERKQEGAEVNRPGSVVWRASFCRAVPVETMRAEGLARSLGLPAAADAVHGRPDAPRHLLHTQT